MRVEILRAATRLFAAQGFDGTSVQEVAEAVGIRKPSLLYHFPSKEELRRAVLDEMTQHWNRVLPEVMLAAARDRRFDSVMESLCSFFLEDPDRARLILRELLDRPEEMKERMADFIGPWVAVNAEQLERAKKRGRVQQDVDTEAYTACIVNLVVGTMAIHESLKTMLPADANSGTGEARHIREIIRIARSSLYVAGRGPDETPP